jgi:hypothetical protein
MDITESTHDRPTAPAAVGRRGRSLAVPAPVLLILGLVFGAGATTATFHWTGAIRTARENAAAAAFHQKRAEAHVRMEEAWREELSRTVRTFAERAAVLDRAAIAEEPEEAVLSLWLLRRVIAAAGEDLPDREHLLQQFDRSRADVMVEVIGMVYEDRPIEDALDAIRNAIQHREG